MWKYKLNSVVLIGLLVLFGVFSLIWWIKPSFSDTENRALAKFPEFSINALVSGEYFKQIDLYFNDTFPMRDVFMEAKASINELKGVGGANGIVIDSPVTAPPEEPITPTPPSSKPETTASNPEFEKPAAPEQAVEQAGPIAYVGDTALELFKFNEGVSAQFSDTVNRFAQAVGPSVDVLTMIAPTSTEFKMPASSAGLSSDQRQAIRFIYDGLSTNVKKVDAYDKLVRHTDEYLYFRTDHHWTQLGAYYGYEALMETEKKTATPLSEYAEIFTYPEFLGTYYNSGKKPQLAQNPDYVDCYMPIVDYEMTTFLDSAQTKPIVGKIIYTNISNYNKYLAFTQGDQNLIQIKPENDAQDHILVIKESYGNALIPWLLPNYNEIHVMDLRQYKGDVQQYIIDNKINKVLICDYVIATSSQNKVNLYKSLLGVE